MICLLAVHWIYVMPRIIGHMNKEKKAMNYFRQWQFQVTLWSLEVEIYVNVNHKLQVLVV